MGGADRAPRRRSHYRGGRGRQSRGRAVAWRVLSAQQAGGEGGIRTLDTLTGITVFETARFNHSRTSPRVLLHELTWFAQTPAEGAATTSATACPSKRPVKSEEQP